LKPLWGRVYLHSVRRSELRTEVNFFSAKHDLELRTLSKLRGRLARLKFCAAQRDRHGYYEHWGLAREHGAAAATKALAEAHCEAFREVLRAPLDELAREGALPASAESVPADIVTELQKDENLLVPADAGGGSAKHLDYVLFVLKEAAGSK
jgi:hypothetical protein